MRILFSLGKQTPMFTFEDLVQDQGFRNEVAELNKAVSAPGDMIEGNIYYPNSETLIGANIESDYARYRAGFVEAVSGRKRLLEIGFNAGHSALTYLYTNPSAEYVGIDLAYRPYTTEAIRWLKERYGERFSLHVGDSTEVLPRIESEIGKFDVIHVDGGHTFDVAFADIWNCYRCLDDRGILIVDDRPAPEVERAINVSLKTRLLQYHSMHEPFKLSCQAYLEKAAS